MFYIVKEGQKFYYQHKTKQGSVVVTSDIGASTVFLPDELSLAKHIANLVNGQIITFNEYEKIQGLIVLIDQSIDCFDLTNEGIDNEVDCILDGFDIILDESKGHTMWLIKDDDTYKVILDGKELE